MLRVLAIALLSLGFVACSGPEQRLASYMEKGKAEYESESFEKARINFANALQIDPENVDARFWAARTAESLERWRRAVRHYQYVVDELDPEHIPSLLRLARIYVVSDQYVLAEGFTNTVLSLEPGNVDALALRGAAYLSAGRQADGEAALRKALAADPANEHAVPALASLLANTGNTGDAIVVLRTAREQNPEFVEASVLVADLLARSGLTDEAARELNELIAKEPGEFSYRVALASLYENDGKPEAVTATLRSAVGAFPERLDAKTMLIDHFASTSLETAIDQVRDYIAADPGQTELRFKEAELLIRGGEFDRAEDIYKAIAGDHAGEAFEGDALTALAQLKINLGDIDAADEHVEAVLLDNPNSAEALLIQSGIAMARDEPANAVVALRAVLRERPDDPTIYDLLSKAHLAQGDIVAAREQLQRAMETNPGDPSLYVNLARFEAQHDRPDAARGVLQRALEFSPRDQAANDLLFRLLLARQDWDAAREQARRMQDLMPDSATGSFYEGLVANRTGDRASAEAAYREALAVEPLAVEPLGSLVSLMLNDSREQEAEEFVTEILDTHPNYTFGWNVRGEIALNRGYHSFAAESFDKAIELSPGWWMAYRGRVWSDLRRGDPDAAFASYERAVAALATTEALVNDVAMEFEVQGRPDLAIRMYETLLEEQPQSTDAANRLAKLLATHGQTESDTQRALELAEPLVVAGNSAYLSTYGWTLLKNGKLEAAQDALSRAAESDAPRAELSYYQAMLEAELGNHESAVALLERALSQPSRFVGYELARAEHERLASRL